MHSGQNAREFKLACLRVTTHRLFRFLKYEGQRQRFLIVALGDLEENSDWPLVAHKLSARVPWSSSQPA